MLAAGVGGAAGVDHKYAVPATDKFLVGVAEEDHVYGLAELPRQGFRGFAFREHEARAVACGGYPGAGPLDVVNHADGDAAGPYDAGGVG